MYKLLLAGAVALTPLFPLAVASADDSPVVRQDELSAAKRKTARRAHARALPADVVIRRAPDPSFDQYGRLYRPPSYIRCPIDLGYGRWGSCETDR